MYARKITLLFGAVLLIFLGACGGGAAKSTLNKTELEGLAVVTTPEHGFRVMLNVNVNFDLLGIIDRSWNQFASCYERALGAAPDKNRAKEFTKVIVSKKWKCTYHGKGCTAEIDFATKKIYLTRKNLDMDKHELAHLYGLLDKDDKRTPKGKKARCFPMTSKG